MTFRDAKELYALFLESDWWIELSRRKRRMVGHCERCLGTERLQSHHRLYRESWFDTRLDDLEVLCRTCHEQEHGIVPQTTVTVTVSTTETTVLNERQSIEQARSRRQISRKQYLVLREQLLAAGRWGGAKQKKIKKARKRKSPVKRKHRQFCTPWHYSPRRTHWVNRGTSSN